MSLQAMGQAARAASYELAVAATALKNKALLAMADELERHCADILAANALDIAAGRDAGLSEAMLDRLLLNESRLAGIVADEDGKPARLGKIAHPFVITSYSIHYTKLYEVWNGTVGRVRRRGDRGGAGAVVCGLLIAP